MAESLEGNVSQPSSVAQPVTSELADIKQLIKYIKRVVPVLLEDDDDIPPALETSLQDKNNAEILKKFISDPQCRAVLIQRSSSKGAYFYSLTISLPILIRIHHKCSKAFSVFFFNVCIIMFTSFFIRLSFFFSYILIF